MRTRLRVDADQTIYALTDYYFYGKEGILTHMKKQRKPIVTYTLSSVMMYGYCLIFSIAALVFLIDKIPAWVQIIMGLLFLAPIVAMLFLSGRKEGETLYKQTTTGTLTAIHDKTPLKVPVYKCFYHVVGFFVPMTLMTLIAGCAHVTALRGIVAFLLMPITVFFTGTGIDMTTVGVGILAMYLPFIWALSLVFCGGYWLGAYKLKRQQGAIESELRSFDN